MKQNLKSLLCLLSLMFIVLPIFRQGLTSINSEQERGGSRLGLTLFRPCT